MNGRIDQVEQRGGSAYFGSEAEFRAWLAAHHTDTAEVLLGFWRKGLGRPGLTYEQARDQALCFGWIDGIRRNIDPESYSIRFTPRKPRSIWSRVNVARYADLLEQGQITPAGIAAYEAPGPRSVYSFEQERPGLDDEAEAAVRANAAAWKFFAAQRPSYQRTAGHWVMSAKRADTRGRRLAALIDDSTNGLWIAPLRDAQPKPKDPPEGAGR